MAQLSQVPCVQFFHFDNLIINIFGILRLITNFTQKPFAQVLNRLKTKRTVVLHGRENLDEAGLGDKTE